MMWAPLPTIWSFLALGSVIALGAPTDSEPRIADTDYTSVCKSIEASVSNATGVYYSLHPLYNKGNRHWALSSSQDSACVVEPGNPDDVSKILQIVANTSTPFGVRSGGHATNPGFSSTPGVQIALFKFSEVTYHPGPAAADGSVGTVDIGTGLVWDSVYAALEPLGVNVVGGRVTGVGVGGFTLGGGYSWLSNQYGLTIDTVTAFEVVLPNGTITTATETTNPDLFFGLKGGFNNFGIVTKFTLLAFPQGQVWGGLQTFTSSRLSRINAATADFAANVTDPKAAIITTYNFLLGQPGVSLLMFYDGPTPPAGIFERFTSIPHFTSDISTRSFPSLVGASPANATYGLRGAFNTVSLKAYSPSLIDQVLNQSVTWGSDAMLKSGAFISYDVESFLPSMNARSKGGAYPHDDFLAPLNLYFAWFGDAFDDWYHSALEESTRVIREQAIAEGQDIAGVKQIKYGNYAPATEDLSSLYGPNLERLKVIKAIYDPKNVMALAGGYRF
ncbi:FAD-dependent oxidoreductase, putative [Rhizoctonia solani AG-3 Rhs1AP]|uniref:FAD-dependent oxidoreductase, putative n=1 Tax=Rhizoctonia solani AG-3 Rhs1AP TaxID=1086054 RepID=X8JFS3_9AGAM|nr:FAD-dependent oxidoreductase, putative [Rhizoctonia solani AG-3 Rhs1AP]